MKHIMKYIKSKQHQVHLFFFGLMSIVIYALPACKPNEPSEEQFFISEDKVAELTADGHLYTLNEFVDKYMTESGNCVDSTLYRTRALLNGSIYLFSIDTLPSGGEGIYIRGRVSTDDYGGNFYKVLVLQQIVDGKQQALRISVDAGSISGMYPRGQEILIRCNGFAIGRYANQVQLCVPAYNNNINANKAEEKVGWAPGRIPAPRFRAATHYIGKPDESKLVYDLMTIDRITASFDPIAARHEDGKLIRIEGIHYTGQCLATDKTRMNCTTGKPTDDSNANVFAPTTNNMNYPQSRIIEDENGNYICVSMSEYAKQAHYYLPGAGSAYDGEVFPVDSLQTEASETPYLMATLGQTTYCVRVSEIKMQQGWQQDDVIFTDINGTTGYIYDGNTWTDKVGILHCPEYVGSIQGILSYYLDNSAHAPTATTWAISICDLSDLNLKKEDGSVWVPMEYQHR